MVNITTNFLEQKEEFPCEYYSITKIDSIEILNVTMESLVLQSTFVKFDGTDVIVDIIFTYVTFKVGHKLIFFYQQPLYDQTTALIVGLKLQWRYQLQVVEDQLYKYVIANNDFPLYEYRQLIHQQSQCTDVRNYDIGKIELEFYLQAFVNAIRPNLINILTKNDYLLQLYKKVVVTDNYIQLHSLDIVQNTIFELNHLKDEIEFILTEEYVFKQLQANYALGTSSAFYQNQTAKELYEETEINAHSLINLFPLMNINSDVFYELVPINGAHLNLSIQEAYVDLTIPYLFVLKELTEQQEEKFYSSFKAKITFRIIAIQNAKGSCPMITEVSFIDFEEVDTAKVNEPQIKIFSSFFAEFLATDRNRALLKKPYNYWVTIKQGRIIMIESVD